LVNRWAGEEIEKSGDEKGRYKGEGGGGWAGVGGHEEDNGPGIGQVEGEGCEHNERAAPDGKKKPREGGGGF
jgi:hypothetical protein